MEYLIILKNAINNENEAINAFTTIKIGLREYTFARRKGESHAEAFEYIVNRVQRFNDKLLKRVQVIDAAGNVQL